jgi:hypothetical protein
MGREQPPMKTFFFKLKAKPRPENRQYPPETRIVWEVWVVDHDQATAEHRAIHHIGGNGWDVTGVSQSSIADPAVHARVPDFAYKYEAAQLFGVSSRIQKN